MEEKKYCSNVMKKHFHKELLMTKKDKEDFESSTKSVIMVILMMISKC